MVGRPQSPTAPCCLLLTRRGNALLQVDMSDIEQAVLHYGDPMELVVDTHRSFEIAATQPQAEGSLVLSSVPQKARNKVDIPNLSIGPLPLQTPRHVEAEGAVQGSESMAEKFDNELRKALEGAKMIGEWSVSLFGGGGLVVPGPVQQVTEQYLRSTECTPAATPRDTETVGVSSPHKVHLLEKGCADPAAAAGRTVVAEGGRGERGAAARGEATDDGKGRGSEDEAKPVWHETLISSLFGSGTGDEQQAKANIADASSPNEESPTQGSLSCGLASYNCNTAQRMLHEFSCSDL